MRDNYVDFRARAAWLNVMRFELVVAAAPSYMRYIWQSAVVYGRGGRLFRRRRRLSRVIWRPVRAR